MCSKEHVCFFSFVFQKVAIKSRNLNTHGTGLTKHTKLSFALCILMHSSVWVDTYVYTWNGSTYISRSHRL